MNTTQIEELLDEMTLEEQVSLLTGADFWTTVPIPRLGVPAFKVTDGPNGARDGIFKDGPSTACFPAGIALGATWNPALIEQAGAALGAEAKLKGARVLLGPTVNLQRTVYNGRNFECYSEDPWLSSELAVAYVRGLQSTGVAATIKHYVGNESEHQRMSMSSEIPERALRELYLLAFERAVKEAGVMAATLVNTLASTAMWPIVRACRSAIATMRHMASRRSLPSAMAVVQHLRTRRPGTRPVYAAARREADRHADGVQHRHARRQ